MITNFQIVNGFGSCERGCRLFLLIDGVAKPKDEPNDDTLKTCKHSKFWYICGCKLSKVNDLNTSTRELFIHGKGMLPYVQLSTNCRIGFLYKENKIYTVTKLSSPQLVYNCTYGTIAFPCIKSSLLQQLVTK